MSDENKPEGTNETDSQKEGWDQKRQHKDEINAAKKREETLKSELDGSQDELSSAQEELEQAKTELEELKETRTNTPNEEGNEGYETYEDMVKIVKDLKGKVGDLETNQKDLLGQTQKIVSTQNAESGAKVLDQLLNQYDNEIGPYRAEVVKEANDWFVKNKITSLPPEQQRVASQSHIKSLYLEHKMADKSKPETEVSATTVDTGEGGVSTLPGIKEGTFDEVRQQMLQQKVGN